MGSHVKESKKLRTIRIGRAKWVYDGDYLSYRVPKTGKAWPQLVKKFEVADIKVEVALKGKSTVISVFASEAELRTVIEGHASSKSFTRSWFVIPIFASLMALLFIPLGTPKSEQPKKQVVESPKNECSNSNIIRYLEMGETSNVIQPIQISFLGGITAGTIECKGSRYSYTLESKEPKRVLNLNRLDT
jgi:hypothetical protein